MSTPVPSQPLALSGVNVSFQSSMANAWGASFLRHLNAELDKAPAHDHHQRMQRVCNAAQAIFNARFHTLPDVPSYTVLGMCGLILSAYRELMVQLGNSGKAFDVVECGFEQTYEAFIQNVCRPLLLSSDHALQTLAKMNFRAWSERMYKTDGSPHEVTLSSDISGYHHFFLEQDEFGLAQIIHTADQVWIETIAAYGQPQLIERRGTRISENANGMGFSPFHFAPSVKKRKEPKLDVILELQVNDSIGRFEENWLGRSSGTDRLRDWDGVPSTRRDADETPSPGRCAIPARNKMVVGIRPANPS